jgi:hypothetical protein
VKPGGMEKTSPTLIGVGNYVIVLYLTQSGNAILFKKLEPRNQNEKNKF